MAFVLNPWCKWFVPVSQHVNAIKLYAPRDTLQFKKCQSSQDFEAEATLIFRREDLKLKKCQNSSYGRSCDAYPTEFPSELLVQYLVQRCMEGLSPTDSLISVRIGVLKNFKEQYEDKSEKLISVLSVRIVINPRVKKKLEDLIDAGSIEYNIMLSDWYVKDSLSNRKYQRLEWNKIKPSEWEPTWKQEYELQLDARNLQRWPRNYLLQECKIEVGVELSVFVNGAQEHVFIPTYFTNTIFNNMFAEDSVQKVFVKGEHGAKFECPLILLKDCSAVLSTQFETRWNGDTVNEVTIPKVKNETVEAFEEFLKFSHIGPATEKFALAVELLEMAHEYIIVELQDKLLDLFYIQPIEHFTDPDILIRLYVFLERSQISACVYSRVGGIVKLKAKEILECKEFGTSNPFTAQLVKDCISSYDVVLDAVSYWVDFHQWVKDTETRKWKKNHRKKHPSLNEEYSKFICNRQLLGLSNYYILNDKD